MKENTLSKTKTGLILTACLIGMLVIDYFAKVAFDFFVLGITIIAANEFRSLIYKAGYPSFVYSAFVMPILAFLVFTVGNLLSLGALWILLLEVLLIALTYAVFFLITFISRKTKSDDFRQATHMTVPGFALFKANNTISIMFYPTFLTLIMYFINHIEELKLAISDKVSVIHYGLFGLVMLFAISCVTDVFAMTFGKIIGGKKIFPKISPNKTLAGALFGLLGGVIGAVLAYYGFVLFAGGLYNSISIWLVLLVGLLGSIVAQVGDLFESYIKRRAGVKDAGDFLRSHGGILDRFDSIILVTPLIFVFMLIFVA